MIIGVPKEIKEHENRVAITPAGVRALVSRKHSVFVQKGAGIGSGIQDKEYISAGAKILPTIDQVYKKAELVLKVKEPLAAEYPFFRKDLLMFTYLHLAANEPLTKELVKSGMTTIGYETIQLANGALPLLVPMSEVAGRMAVQVGAQFLEARNGGRGILLSGTPGVPPADVVIIGAGIVGYNAAKIAVGMGAQVVVMDNNPAKLRQMEDLLSGRVITNMSTAESIEKAVCFADLVIGAVLVVGARAPRLVTAKMVQKMKPGSVIVDVAIDQGGCIETSHVTMHSKPTYEKFGVIHYAVGNMPGAVPRTSTFALTNETLPYLLQIADKGYEKAIAENYPLAKGVNTHQGCVTHPAVASAFKMKCAPVCCWE